MSDQHSTDPPAEDPTHEPGADGGPLAGDHDAGAPGDVPEAGPEEQPEDSIEALRDELERARQLYQRAAADYQNLKRRSQEERAEFGRYTLTSLVINFLPVLDDLTRGLEAAREANADPAWLEGVQLVEQKFKGVLEASGVREIEALNQPFDPQVHEAMGYAPGPEGVVVHLVQRGYAIDDRVIRPTRVMVGSGEAGATDGPTGGPAS